MMFKMTEARWQGVQGFMIAALFSILIGAALASFYYGARHEGYMSGLNKGWSDCSTPVADAKNDDTHCPKSDYPSEAGLNLL